MYIALDPATRFAGIFRIRIKVVLRAFKVLLQGADFIGNKILQMISGKITKHVPIVVQVAKSRFTHTGKPQCLSSCHLNNVFCFMTHLDAPFFWSLCDIKSLEDIC